MSLSEKPCGAVLMSRLRLRAESSVSKVAQLMNVSHNCDVKY
jgi:hypothetical protein